MAIKFFKVLGGLSKLFKSEKTEFSNLTDTARNKGITENSIVHVSADRQDTSRFGARYLPNTSILYVNGQPHIDSKNILFGVSMQIYERVPVFIAPVGLVEATDEVRYARILKTDAAGIGYHGGDTQGLTIPNQSAGIMLKYYGVTEGSKVMEKWAFSLDGSAYMVMSELAEVLNAESKNGAVLANAKIAFSIWRNEVQVSDWCYWYFDGSQLKVEKGLYLPGVQEIAYEKLLNKVSTGTLIPGRKYRIIDYKTTSAQPDVISAGVQFDIITYALSADTLDERVSAIANNLTTPSGYYPERWTIKYTVNNDTERFAWADSTNGTGVIYYMIDEWGNEAGFDFKNLRPLNPNTNNYSPVFLTSQNTDASIKGDLNFCYGNTIGVNHTEKVAKNSNIFGSAGMILTSIHGSTDGNIREYDLQYIPHIFITGHDNIIGNDCNYITITGSSNKIGTHNVVLTLSGSSCIIGNSNSNLTFSNTVGITVGSENYKLTFNCNTGICGNKNFGSCALAGSHCEIGSENVFGPQLFDNSCIGSNNKFIGAYKIHRCKIGNNNSITLTGNTSNTVIKDNNLITQLKDTCNFTIGSNNICSTISGTDVSIGNNNTDLLISDSNNSYIGSTINQLQILNSLHIVIPGDVTNLKIQDSQNLKVEPGTYAKTVTINDAPLTVISPDNTQHQLV